MSEFFKNEKHLKILEHFKVRIKGLMAEGEFEENRNHFIYLVISSILSKPDEWDLNCQINIDWVGNHLIEELSSGKELNKKFLDDIASLFFRFLLELDLSRSIELSMEYRKVKNYLVENIKNFTETAQREMEFVLLSMPITIFKKIANSNEISNLKEFNKISNKAESLKKDWENQITEKESRVNKLKDALEEYENGFNFVGLYQGFDELAKQKEKELSNNRIWLVILGLITIIPIFSQFFFIQSNAQELQPIKEALYISMLPAISIVLISLYFFKVLLSNFKSLKSQILQIQLRMTLCRFIQSYADYSSGIKKNDSEALSKFENIIFSGLVADDKTLPSTFDGLEQFSSFIKSLK